MQGTPSLQGSDMHSGLGNFGDYRAILPRYHQWETAGIKCGFAMCNSITLTMKPLLCGLFISTIYRSSKSTSWISLVHSNNYSVSQKNPPLGFVVIFPKRLGIFRPNFTCLLYVPIYARPQILIQLSATLTKLCHIKCDHPACISIDGGHFEHITVVALNMA